MKPVQSGIQFGMFIAFVVTIVTCPRFAAAATYPSCPSGKTCLDVTTASATGSGCTLANAINALNTKHSQNGCNYPSNATVVRVPLISGSSTTYFPNTLLSLVGATIKGLSVTQTIINFKNAPASGPAIDVTAASQTAVGIQFIAVVDGGSSQTLTGIQTEPGAPTLTLDHVLVNGFNNSGVVNNSFLVVHNSTIQNNFGDFGGGIHDMQYALMSIDTSTIAYNGALGGGGIGEEGESWLAYDTIGFNNAEVGGGVYISDDGSDPVTLDAFHVTVAMNTASDPYFVLPCGVGGGVYAPNDDGLIDANWNASIITGNTDGTPQADDLVGDLHFSSEEDSDGGNMAIVGNAQLGTSCQVGHWRWVPFGVGFPLNDQQASPAQLFGTSNPTLAAHPSSAPTQDLALVRPKSGTNPAINAGQNNIYNIGTYETQGAIFPSKYTSGKLNHQNNIDQGGQRAPSDGNQNLSYCIGSFEIQ